MLALSRLLDDFKRSLDSPTSSLPSVPSQVKSYKEFNDLSNYITEFTNDFVMHLATSNQIKLVAIYRIGFSYAYFDSNVALVANISFESSAI